MSHRALGGQFEGDWRDEHPPRASRPENPIIDKMFAGTLKKHVYPDEFDKPLYHGSRKADLEPGQAIVPGMPGNFVKRMKHVYATEDISVASHYAGPQGHVYEVRPSGPIGKRSDARGPDWASQHPYEVVRKIPRPGR